MDDFSIVNLLEIDDTVGERVPGVEGRFARVALGATHLGVSHFRYGPGYQAAVGHSHREQEEVYIVISGSGSILLGDRVEPIGPWDAVRVSPTTVRAFRAGPDGLEVLAVGSDRPEGGDGSRAVVNWPE